MKNLPLTTGPIVLDPARRVRGFFKFWWNKIPEPQMVSLITGAVYLVFFTTGLVTLLNPPTSIEGVFGTFTMQMVGYFLIGGALVGIIGGMRNWWEVERVGIGGMSIGVLTYLYIVIELQLASESGSRFTQMGIILTALGFLALRMALIWRYPFKPRR